MWDTFPQGVSTYAAEIDGIYTVILWITGAIFVLVEAALVLFVVKYRHREGRRATHIHGNWRIEAVWTAVPFAIVIWIVIISMGPWRLIRDPESIPADAFEIGVTAKQFEWNASYTGPDGRLDTDDDVVERNRLFVPANRPVVVRLRSEDVIHSFFLPSMRVKQDAVPGMEQHVWFEATTPGEYVLGCAELCGLGHYRMRGTVTVLPEAEWQSWLAASGAGATTAGRLSLDSR
ncbi:MAG: cytochrome c oxidase subunit II [Longimicrobiales bacterium]